MKINFKYLIYSYLVTIINFVTAGDCDGEFENEIETFCSGEEIKIVLSECLIEKHGIYAPEFYLSGEGSDEVEKCFGHEENGNWIFSTSPLECNTNIFTNATHIVYTNYLHGKIGTENAIISRSKPMTLEFKCVFSNEIDIGLQDPVQSKEDSMEVEMEHQTGQFEVEMNLFASNKFSIPLIGPLTLNIPDEMHVGISLHNAADDANVLLKKCWATPQPNADHSMAFVFIENFCGSPFELDSEALTIFENGKSAQASFSLASFDWFHDEEAKIYVHCTVKICHSTLGDCSANCESKPALRWRRSRGPRAVLDDNYAEETVAIGPIYLGKRNPYY